MSKNDFLYSSYINGQWRKGTQELLSFNPADSSQIVARFTEATTKDVEDAGDAAKGASKSWAQTPAPVRAGIIQNFGRLVENNKESLAKIVSLEIGKPYKESLGSIQEVSDTCNFFVSEGRRLYGQTIPSEMPQKECFTYRRPVGVFGFITACNFPAAVPAWYFIPALVAGNTCVWKPSEEAPLTSYYLTELLHQAGLPKGVFNTIFGGPQVGAALINLIETGVFDKIGFTGSTPIGRKIGEICGRNLIVPCLELGGKNPLVVCEDAQIELALEGALFSGLTTGGQRCTSMGNLIIHEKIYDSFLSRLVQKIKAIKIGDPFDTQITYGPLISGKYLENHIKNLQTLIKPHHELPLGRGGRIGAENPWELFSGNEKNGYYASPTIVSNVQVTDDIYNTETFGPLFNVMKYSDFDEAILFANKQAIRN